MNTSLKNNKTEFINLKEFLTKQLLRRKILIQIPKGVNLFETDNYHANPYPVTINDNEVITFNFRLLYLS